MIPTGVQNLSPGICQAGGQRGLREHGPWDTSHCVSLWLTVETTHTSSSGSSWTQKSFSHHQTRCVECSTCCIPHQSEPPVLPPHPFGGQGSETLDQHYPSNFTGRISIGMCEGIYPPTTETTGCELFLETLMQLIKFQECVSEPEQDFTVMILL